MELERRRRSQLVRDYSGGMIRRLEIAQSMLHRPARPVSGRADGRARSRWRASAVWEHVQRLRARLRHDDPPHDPLHGRGRRALRPAGDHAPRRGRQSSGSPAELKARPGGTTRRSTTCSCATRARAMESGGSYRDVSRTRTTARRARLSADLVRTALLGVRRQDVSSWPSSRSGSCATTRRSC